MADSERQATMKNLGDLCETIGIAAREAQFAVVEGDPQAMADSIERLGEEHARLRTAYRMWLGAVLGPVSDSRASV